MKNTVMQVINNDLKQNGIILDAQFQFQSISGDN
jgi:hypothetical protein